MPLLDIGILVEYRDSRFRPGAGVFLNQMVVFLILLLANFVGQTEVSWICWK
jgi:hypothetical protein